ncbi:MAG: arylesterase [Halioglobus sp.]
MIIQKFLFRIIRDLTAFGLLLTAIVLPASATSDGGVPKSQHTVLVMGDSISAAYGMSLEQGWVALMAGQMANTHPDIRIVNASISGETAAGGARRLPALLEEHEPSLVIIELGGNDGLRGYPVKSFRNDLRNMTELSQAAGAQVLILAMEIPPNYGTRYTASFRESYPKVALETGAVLGPFLLEGVATNTELMQADGIHPTVEAQPILLETVMPVVAELLEL